MAPVDPSEVVTDARASRHPGSGDHVLVGLEDAAKEAEVRCLNMDAARQLRQSLADVTESELVKTLTARQVAVCCLVRDGIDRDGKAPTYGEMAEALGLKISTVSDHVSALVAKGALVKTHKHAARALRVAEGLALPSEPTP